VNAKHALIESLTTAGADLAKVHFRSCRRLELAETGDELLSFGPELPALVLGRRGGRVAVFAGGLDGEGSDFTRCPEFVPFCQELVMYLSGTFQGRLAEFTVKQHVPLHVEASPPPTDVMVFPPGSQEGIVLMPSTTPGRRVFWKTDVPGCYRVAFKRGNMQWESAFVVNTAPSESDLRRLEADDLKKLVNAASVRIHSDTPAIATAPAFGASRRGDEKEITLLLVAAALALCAGEAFFANRIYGKSSGGAAAESQTSKNPSESSTRLT
jgi:hypothetical protein